MVYGTRRKTFKDTGKDARAVLPELPGGPVIRDFDDNLIFDDEVVGAPVIWAWSAPAASAAQPTFRFPEEPEAPVSHKRLAA